MIIFSGINRGVPRASAPMYSMPLAAASPYAQPVIYIHPDSLSTGYPLSAMGLAGMTAYPNTAPAYASGLETIYTPYNNRDNSRHGKS